MSLQRVRPERSISCTRPAGTEERNNTNSTWALASGLTSLVRIEISSSLGIRSGDRGELLSRPGEVEEYTRGVDLHADSRPHRASPASLPVSPHCRPRIRRRRDLRRHGGGGDSAPAGDDCRGTEELLAHPGDLGGGGAVRTARCDLPFRVGYGHATSGRLLHLRATGLWACGGVCHRLSGLVEQLRGGGLWCGDGCRVPGSSVCAPGGMAQGGRAGALGSLLLSASGGSQAEQPHSGIYQLLHGFDLSFACWGVPPALGAAGRRGGRSGPAWDRLLGKT